jgi:hypothetical protein
MSCHKLGRELTAYISGELDKLDRQRIEEHLKDCSSCQKALASLESTREMLESWADVEPPPDLFHEFQTRLSEAVGRKRTKALPTFGWLSRRWVYGLIVTACIAVAVYSGFHLLDPSHEKPLEVANTRDIQIGFYIAEHESSLNQVPFRKAAFSPREPLWVPFRKEDLMYYDTFSGEREEARRQSGLILKGGNQWKKPVDAEEKPGTEDLISEGEVLSLADAQKAVSFHIVAPAVLSEAYRLAVVKKIHDRECIQLVYSDEANTISLFEQPILPEERLSRGDFREYILHLGKDRDRTAVLGWHSDNVSFNLVGEMKLPELMEIADQIQERLVTDRVKQYYQRIYEE